MSLTIGKQIDAYIKQEEERLKKLKELKAEEDKKKAAQSRFIVSPTHFDKNDKGEYTFLIKQNGTNDYDYSGSYRKKESSGSHVTVDIVDKKDLSDKSHSLLDLYR